MSLKDKHLIFTITPGRSGTGYLANLCSCIPDTISLHEPDPDFAYVMRKVQNNSKLAYEFLINVKLPHIASLPTKHYIETSHLFCKGFFEPLLDIDIKFDVVFLKRNKRDVALSLYQLNTIPGRTSLGLQYLLHPMDPDVLPLKDWEKLHDYQLCYWYCLEIDRRMQKYHQIAKQKGLSTIDTNIENLRSFKGFRKFVSVLSLPEPNWREFFRLRNQKINQKQYDKTRKIIDINRNLDVMEQEVRDLIKDKMLEAKN